MSIIKQFFSKFNSISFSSKTTPSTSIKFFSLVGGIDLSNSSFDLKGYITLGLSFTLNLWIRILLLMKYSKLKAGDLKAFFDKLKSGDKKSSLGKFLSDVIFSCNKFKSIIEYKDSIYFSFKLS